MISTTELVEEEYGHTVEIKGMYGYLEKLTFNQIKNGGRNYYYYIAIILVYWSIYYKDERCSNLKI